MSIDFDYQAFPDQLNLGCGLLRRDGYLNVDLHGVHQPDLVADVRQLHMLPSGYYRRIIAHDILEHLGRTRVVETLGEWCRLLKTGGELELKVPSLLDALIALREANDMEQQRIWLRAIFGSQYYEGDYHYTSFTRELLHADLARAGFEMRSCESVDSWLFLVEAVKTTDPNPEDDCLFERDDARFLERAYHSFLGRDPDPEGAAHYGEGLRSGEMSREAIMELLASAKE